MSAMKNLRIIPPGKCQCGCGQKTSFARDGTRKKFVKSHNMSRIKHGHRRTKGRTSAEYTAWRNMINRCYLTRNNSYKYAGARGITVCERWLHSFENFIA